MMQLHLQKSRQILNGRLRFIRISLTGKQQKPVVDSVAIKKRDLFHKAQLLSAKFPLTHSNNQKSTVSISVQKQAVVRPAKSWRGAVFTALMSTSFALLLVLFAPVIYFRFFAHEVVPVQTTETGTVLGGDFSPKPEEQKPAIQQPPREEGLPEGNWIVIPRIGVRTEILESEDPEESLIKGVWRAPEFGAVGDTKQPLILAAHRYGYNWWWKGEYWKYHSFYLLPDLQPGDLVEVISDKRKYLYEIYSGEEGIDISDYEANLILYTCKFLNSDVRHFRYARLIDPSKYGDYVTQVENIAPQTP
jgi:hypothetical protein